MSLVLTLTGVRFKRTSVKQPKRLRHFIYSKNASAYKVTSPQLLKSYLTDRTQRCYVNGVLSTEQYVSCGIPQGSILGLLLFINYILNDFSKCLQQTTPGMFADDTYITTAHEDISTIECFLKGDLTA